MADDQCGICGLAAEPVLLQMCFRCDTLYHLNPYSNVAGIDCGDAIIGTELGLYYYCSPCIVAINEELNELVLQESQQREAQQRQPGWRATPAADAAPSEAPAPSSAPASATPSAAPPRAAGSPPRRRFRRIDQ